jgi:hypothetical protein
VLSPYFVALFPPISVCPPIPGGNGLRGGRPTPVSNPLGTKLSHNFPQGAGSRLTHIFSGSSRESTFFELAAKLPL